MSPELVEPEQSASAEIGPPWTAWSQVVRYTLMSFELTAPSRLKLAMHWHTSSEPSAPLRRKGPPAGGGANQSRAGQPPISGSSAMPLELQAPPQADVELISRR